MLALGAGAVAAGAAVSLLRHPGGVAWDTVYAEDGAVFLADAVAAPGWGGLLSAYAGYYHLVPRLLGALAAAFPAPAAATVLAVSAAAVTAGVAVLVFVASTGHLSSLLARVLVAAPVVVAPLAQQEVPNSVANLHWPALYAVFWLLIWTPPGRVGRMVAPAVLLLTALSDILIVAFLPLAALRWLLRRDRYSAVLAGLLAIGIMVQMTARFTGSGSRDLTLDPLPPVTGYLLRAVPATVLGERWLPEAGADPRRLALAAAAWLLLAVVLLVAVRRVTSPRWVLAGAAAAQSVVLYGLPVVLTGVAPSRYAVAPGLLLVVALVALLHPAPPPAGSATPAGPATTSAGPAAGGEQPAPAPPRRATRAPLVAFALLCIAVWTVNLQVDTERTHGPGWRAEVDRAQMRCAEDATARVELRITPAASGWRASLPCDYLVD